MQPSKGSLPSKKEDTGLDLQRSKLAGSVCSQGQGTSKCETRSHDSWAVILEAKAALDRAEAAAAALQYQLEQVLEISEFSSGPFDNCV